MFTTNTRKYVVMGSCAGMIILDVVLMVASNADKMENGYSNLDSKLDLKYINRYDAFNKNYNSSNIFGFF